MREMLFGVLVFLPGCRGAQEVPARAPELTLTWEKNMLGVLSPEIPGGRIDTWYLEAYCRSGSTNRNWRETVIPHKTEKLSASDKVIELMCKVEGGVEVRHRITAGRGEVDFQVEAVNRGPAYVDAIWVQPCTRVGKFTGGDKMSYIPKCFIWIDGKPTFLDKTRWSKEAFYTPGQVYVPASVDRKDVNPRPLSKDVPTNGLIGCVSADGKLLFATAWEPYQELFQGVITCIHSDFRLGGLKPGETKRARGKMYVMENDVEKLLARYLRDFPGQRTTVRGTVLDEAGKPMASRVYVERNGEWHFPKSLEFEGSAVEYRKARLGSTEMHTTLSAHPFGLELEPGTYTFTVERGKEYVPETRRVEVGTAPLDLTFKPRRWINMAERGWYSGDTHVHRPLEELPNLMRAEDLNVAFPLLYWVTKAYTAPQAKGDPGAKPIEVDPTHVIYPRNTEYEIFSVDGKPHTLGAVFVLNHKSVFEEGVPPLGPMARKARAEGALFELDKHNWPWSMALVPVLNVDLYELSNNHVWRTEFGFREFGEREAEYMKIERTEKGFTERGWIDFGFRNYYALLNCGLHLRPTAGTASGVHPVPLGFGRVYVRLDRFSYDAWLEGLNAGRSFVSTGPMLFLTLEGRDPGHAFPAGGRLRLEGAAESPSPLRVEVVVNGEVVRALKGPRIDETLSFDSSGWVAVRCFEEGPRPRFAHTAPWRVEVPGRPLRPHRDEVDYLIRRVESQIERSGKVLPEAAVDEYRQALKFYEGKRAIAR